MKNSVGKGRGSTWRAVVTFGFVTAAIDCAPSEPAKTPEDTSYLEGSCRGGSQIACAQLADMYERGDRVAKNPEYAAQLRRFQQQLVHQYGGSTAHVASTQPTDAARATKSTAACKKQCLREWAQCAAALQRAGISGTDARNNQCGPPQRKCESRCEAGMTGDAEPNRNSDETRASAQCEDWFDPIKAARLLACGLGEVCKVKQPPDIRRAVDRADALCAKSRLPEKECRRKEGETYCGQRAELIAKGGDPNDPGIRAEEVKTWQAAQSITAAEEKKLLPVGQAAVWAQLKAPSTAKLVSAAPVFRCLDGALVAEYAFDAQNSFGAMLRGHACAFVGADGRSAMVIDCLNVVWAPSVAKGDIDVAVQGCGLYSSMLK